MAIVAGMFWIFLGVFYILYKLGSEEFDGGVKGGIMVALIPIVLIAVMGGVPYVLSLIFGDDGIIGFWILFLVCLVFFAVKWKREEIENERKRDAELKELNQSIRAGQEKEGKPQGGSNDNP